MFEKLVNIICNYVEVEQSEVMNIRTVGEAVDYLEKLSGEN